MLSSTRPRGADLSNWSFLTGERDPVAAVVTKWGIGSLRQPDGSIDHTLITFLVHEGRVMERYTTRAGRDEALLADVVDARRRSARDRGAERSMGIAPRCALGSWGGR